MQGSIDGVEGLYTRAELHDADKPWWRTKKARASEYNTIYKVLKQRAVQLTSERAQPVSALQAADDMAIAYKVGVKAEEGGMTVYGFMQMCRSLVAQQKKERQAAAAEAAAAAAAEEEQVDDDS